MKKLLLLVTFAAACKQEVQATVECQVQEGPTIGCVVKETKGSAEIEVCWDFAVTCANKATLTAPRACMKVDGGGTVTHTTSKEQIVKTGECDKDPAATVTNLTINGEKAQVQ